MEAWHWPTALLASVALSILCGLWAALQRRAGRGPGLCSGARNCGRQRPCSGCPRADRRPG